MKNLYPLLFLATICMMCTNPTSRSEEEAAKPTQPNILFILADDLGREWVSVYGAEDIHTPHVDQLAAGGMRFTNAWSMPQCTPTRATLLSGQYPWRHGWVNHWDVPRWGAGCHFDAEYYPSFARILKEAGYRTAAAGKWQINDFRVEPDAMVKHGFDDYCMWTGFEAGNPPSAERYWDPYLHTKEGSKTYEGQFGEDIFTDFLIDFMSQNKDHPMLLYYPMCLPHGPLVPTPTEPDVTEPMDKYKAMVKYVDAMLGKMVNALEELGLRENTIIIWTTDNGSSRGIVGTLNGKKVNGGKARLTQNGTAMPFVVNGPGRVPAGMVTNALTDFTDFLPTVTELGNAKLPEGKPIDGYSLAKVITGEVKEGPREWIMSVGGYPAKLKNGRVVPRVAYAPRAVANQQYKLIIDENRQSYALYDIIADPFEEENILESEMPAIRQARQELEAVAANFPDQDAAPAYTPNPPQLWDVKADKHNEKNKRSFELPPKK